MDSNRKKIAPAIAAVRPTWTINDNKNAYTTKEAIKEIENEYDPNTTTIIMEGLNDIRKGGQAPTKQIDHLRAITNPDNTIFIKIPPITTDSGNEEVNEDIQYNRTYTNRHINETFSRIITTTTLVKEERKTSGSIIKQDDFHLTDEAADILAAQIIQEIECSTEIDDNNNKEKSTGKSKESPKEKVKENKQHRKEHHLRLKAKKKPPNLSMWENTWPDM